MTASSAWWRIPNETITFPTTTGTAVTFIPFISVPRPRRRCGVCGRFARTIVRTEVGIRLAWEHAECARRLGMAAVR